LQKSYSHNALASPVYTLFPLEIFDYTKMTAHNILTMTRSDISIMSNSVFEKTFITTQENVKSHDFFGNMKKRKIRILEHWSNYITI